MPPIAEWPGYVSNVAERLASRLGVAPECKVQAQLYKLLMYEEGDHFNPHRDSEKEDGMFATMVLLLPSAYTVSQHTSLFSDAVFWLSKDGHHLNISDKMPEKTGFCSENHPRWSTIVKHEILTALHLMQIELTKSFNSCMA